MPGEKKPNIVVIMSDQHNKKVLGCYGDNIVRTPNLDRLASEGIKFNSAYCPSPLCVPSRMSFLTSCMPSQNMVWTNAHILDSEKRTWPDYLNDAGYETFLIGRMHFIGPDQKHGFQDRVKGDLLASWDNIPSVSCGQRGASVRVAGKGVSQYIWYDSMISEEACSFLKEYASGNQENPFAAVIGFLQPHSPYVAPEELFNYYYEKLGDEVSSEYDLPEQVKRHIGLHDFSNISKDEIRSAKAAYYAMCENMDSLIGDIINTIDESGLADNTLIVYCSDHGDMLGEHGCWFKSTHYEGSAGVPLIMRYKGIISEGVESNHVCNLADLGATFVDLAGENKMVSCAGKSLAPLFDGINDNWGDETFCELVNDKSYPGIPSKMIRSGKYKLWTTVYPDSELDVMFDLEADPDENNNLADRPEFADIKKNLKRKLYEGWNPECVVEMSERQKGSTMSALEEFGRLWEHGGYHVIAPEGIDADVVLCE